MRYSKRHRIISTTSSPAASVRWAMAVVRREYDAIGRLACLRHGEAAVTEYAYDVHSWPVSQYTTYGTAANASSLGYTLEYAPCYNGNISKRTWAEGGYTYTYDALNRLASAVFTPAEGLADRPAIERDRIPDFSVYYDYDLRGNATNVVRYGVVDAVSDFDRIETFGTLDEMSCTYDGNQLSNISAITEALPFDGVTGLHANGEFELSYNDAGDLVSDTSRGLLYTRWNADGHPMQYDIEGGHRQRLGWDAFGNHLYTSYETSVAPVSAGSLPGRTRRTSLRAYSGDGHVLRGGAGNSAADTLEMIRFAGGYFDENLVPHYYVTDYLGSNIAVIRSDGTLVQSVTYYPYGEPHRDPSASAGLGISEPGKPTSGTSIANPYLYGGKEYVRRDGLREYIYGARMCIPSETRFNSMDKLCEKHPDQSPYLFCGGNPIRYVDPTGLIFTDNAIPYAKELVAEAFSRMQNSDISKEDKDKYAQVIREIGSMLVSEQTFDVEIFDEENCESQGVNNAPHTYYNMDNDAVTFAYPSYMFQKNESNDIKNLRLGDTAHEFKHGYQFLNGDLDLAASRGGVLMLSKGIICYDITDERAAYDREELFSGRHTDNQGILGNPQYRKIGRKQRGIGDIAPSDYPDINEKAKTFNRVVRTRNGKIFRP